MALAFEAFIDLYLKNKSKQIHYQVIITYRLTVNLLEYFLTKDLHLTFVRCNQNHELLVLTKYIMRINNL